LQQSLFKLDPLVVSDLSFAKINKLLTKLPLILLSTIMTDAGLFDCPVLPQQGYKQGSWARHP
jgi:hypothetical protein